MKVRFQNEYNYISEAKYFLMLYYANEDFTTLKETLKKKAGYNDHVKQALDELQMMFEEIIQACSPLPQECKLYFESNASETLFTCLADSMLLEGEEAMDVCVHDMGAYLKECFHKDNKVFVSSVLEPESLSYLKAVSNFEFFDRLEKLTIEDETKWKIWRVFNNYDKHIDTLMGLIERIVPVMEEIYKQHETSFLEYINYWKHACEEGTFFDHLKAIFPIDLNETKGDVEWIIVPTLMACNSLRLFTLDEVGEKTFMHMGVLLKDQGITHSRENFTRDDICNRFKLLSDTSKYEILSLTKDKKLYGSQLAESLNLTTATISHHVSALTSVGLLAIEKDSNRVYYHLNKEQIGFIIDQLRKDLYED